LDDKNYNFSKDSIAILKIFFVKEINDDEQIFLWIGKFVELTVDI
jgi:hypothetical protein